MTSAGPATSGAQWTIEADGKRAVVVEVGGVLRDYTADGRQVLDSFGTDELSPASAGQILAPWPNRIRDGQYTFQGVDYQLALTEPPRRTAIHGLTNWIRWTLVEQAPDAITVEGVVPAQQGYPWWLTLRTRWSVSSAGLRCDQSVVNNSATDAPWGYSIHPYLQLTGVPINETLLHVPAKARIVADARLLPIGTVPVAGTEYDFSEPRKIGELVLDTTFSDIEHDADGITELVVADPNSDARVSLWADEKFKHWQVYSGDTLHGERFRRSLAIEPMTCPPDAFRTGKDLIVLAPGETWTCAWGIKP